jgi:hypothetical protein
LKKKGTENGSRESVSSVIRSIGLNKTGIPLALDQKNTKTKRRILLKFGGNIDFY